MKYLVQILDTLFCQTSCLEKDTKHRVFKTIMSFTSFTRSLHPMGYSLIILFLLLSSCTDNKKESTTPESTTPESATPETQVYSEEKEDPNTKPLFASYENGIDLIRIDTTITEKYLSKDLIKNYRTLFKEVSSDQHYLATLEITNDILYVVDPDYVEKSFNAQQHEPITYAGSLSPLQRLYVDSDDQLYLKTLTPFKDEYYVKNIWYTDGRPDEYVTNKLTSPVFPCTTEEDGSYGVTYYTNKEGMNFTRNWEYYNLKGVEYEGVLLIYLNTI